MERAKIVEIALHNLLADLEWDRPPKRLSNKEVREALGANTTATQDKAIEILKEMLHEH